MGSRLSGEDTLYRACLSRPIEAQNLNVTLYRWSHVRSARKIVKRSSLDFFFQGNGLNLSWVKNHDLVFLPESTAESDLFSSKQTATTVNHEKRSESSFGPLVSIPQIMTRVDLFCSLQSVADDWFRVVRHRNHGQTLRP